MLPTEDNAESYDRHLTMAHAFNCYVAMTIASFMLLVTVVLTRVPGQWLMSIVIFFPLITIFCYRISDGALRIATRQPRYYRSPVIALLVDLTAIFAACVKLTLIDANSLNSYIPIMAVSMMALFAVMAWRTTRHEQYPRYARLFLCFYCLAFSTLAVRVIDCVYDTSVPVVYTTQVLSEHTERGARSLTYYMLVGPWGPYRSAQDIEVSASWYRSIPPGSYLDVSVRRGALGAAWYRLDRAAGCRQVEIKSDSL